MRTSPPATRSRRTRSRLIRSGLVTGTLTTTALLATAVPALAANVTVTLSAVGGLSGGGETITATAAGFAAGVAAPAAIFSTAAACPNTYVAGAGNLPAVTTKTSDNAVGITVPASVMAPTTYKVCIYGGNTGTSAVIGNAAAYSVAPAAATLNPGVGPAGGGNTITVTAPSAFLTGTTTPVVLFSTAACPSPVGAPTAGLAAPLTRNAANNGGTVTAPNGVTAPNAYNLCFYPGTNADSPLIAVSAGMYQATQPTAVLNPTIGPSGGGNTIGATAGFFGGLTAPPGITFAPAPNPCPPAYSPGNLAAGNITKISDTQLSMTVPNGVQAPNGYTACFYSSTNPSNSTLIGISSGPYTLLVPMVMLSSRVGPTAGLNTITATSNIAFLGGVSTPGVTFATNPCPAMYPSGSSASSVVGTGARVTSVKAAVTVPTGLVLGTQYTVCLFAGTDASSPLVASSSAKYTVAPPTSITGVSPATGPAMGGSKITVTGAGFPMEPGSISATIGGVPLLSVTPVSASQFTAVTPPHAPGTGVPFRVTTAAGTFTWGPGFTYSNGVVVTPNTTPSRDSVLVDIAGVDFLSINFTTTTGNTANDSHGHVYLVDLDAGESYNPAHDANNRKTTPPAAECTNVLTISDTELLCTLALTSSLTATGTPAAGVPVLDGAYNLTVVSDGRMDATDYTASNISSGSTFTVADY